MNTLLLSRARSQAWGIDANNGHRFTCQWYLYSYRPTQLQDQNMSIRHVCKTLSGNGQQQRIIYGRCNDRFTSDYGWGKLLARSDRVEESSQLCVQCFTWSQSLRTNTVSEQSEGNRTFSGVPRTCMSCLSECASMSTDHSHHYCIEARQT